MPPTAITPWILQQLSIAALTLPGASVIGPWCLSRSGRPLWRALAWACGLLFVLLAVSAGAKGYYLGAVYVYLLAAGAVAIDGCLEARPGRLRNLMLGTAVITAVLVAEVLPVLPPADLARTVYKSNTTPLETIGGPQLVRTVDAVWTSLPPSQRASAVRLAGRSEGPFGRVEDYRKREGHGFKSFDDGGSACSSRRFLAQAPKEQDHLTVIWPSAWT